jgi:signal transduction histidine kinase
LFEPFAPSGPSAGQRELGLGLYIARLLARAHEGELRLIDGDADRVVFEVELPRRLLQSP